MRLHRFVYVVLPAVVAWTFSVGQAEPRAKNRLVLLSHQEAKQLRLTEDEWRQRTPRARAISFGPRIIIQVPQVRETDAGHTINTVTPTDLSIVFEENRSPVNMDSLEIQARKGLFSKSLTSLLRPYIQGTTLQVQGAEVSPGRFLLEITIADQNGARTVEAYHLEVSR